MQKQWIKSRCGNTLEDKKVYATVEIYISDFGTLKILPNRFQRERDAFVFDMSMWQVASLRPIRTEPLAKTGDSDCQQLVGELTLVSCNEAASGVVADLTVS